MVKLSIFLFNLAVNCNRQQIIERAAGLTLRVLLAFFPFIVFLMSLMGFMELDVEAILSGLYYVLPQEISELITYFILQLSETRSAGILSAALFFSIYNSTNGFRAVIRYTNMADERRGIVGQVLLSFVLMILFSVALIIMLTVLVFGRHILSFFFPYASELFFTLASSLGALVVLFFVTLFIYKLSCAKPVLLRHVAPGAVITVLAWVITSAAFGLITRHFSQLPAIYGSMAGLFILILWLNSVSVILLVGNEINALLATLPCAKMH
ncbi:MAG: YihY/virulence factor BrkB family protein [Defluviitaleaceae bacterium]|nr:YihY/virulence factor BrkB family protein [Defluviitaleaceae bacterium]